MGVKFKPAGRARLISDLHANVLRGLPQGEKVSVGFQDHSHAACVWNVNRIIHQLGT